MGALLLADQEGEFLAGAATPAAPGTAKSSMSLPLSPHTMTPASGRPGPPSNCRGGVVWGWQGQCGVGRGSAVHLKQGSAPAERAPRHRTAAN